MTVQLTVYIIDIYRLQSFVFKLYCGRIIVCWGPKLHKTITFTS